MNNNLELIKETFYRVYIEGKRDGLILALNHLKENLSEQKKEYLISILESLIKGYGDQI